MNEFIPRLGSRPVVAVLRAERADRFLEVCQVITTEGIPAVEITMTTRGALEAIATARSALHPSVLIGAGTIRSLDQLTRAVDAGAQFLVSQLTDPALVEAAADRGIPFIPGALTPNEIAHAWRLGVEAVKVSPVGPVGGLAYLSELVGPLPDVRLFPTGGVRIEEAAEYLAGGAALIGLSRDLFRDSLSDGGDIAALAHRARGVVESIDALTTSTIAAGRV